MYKYVYFGSKGRLKLFEINKDFNLCVNFFCIIVCYGNMVIIIVFYIFFLKFSFFNYLGNWNMLDFWFNKVYVEICLNDEFVLILNVFFM